GNRLSFQYDLVGNRTARSRSGPGAFTERYTYNAADQLVSRSGGPDGTVTYDFDADGNQTRAGAVRVRYDLENHPVLVDNGRQQIGYRYDADGNRLSAAVSGRP